MKRSELFFSFLLLPIDFLMIVLAAISAYHIRFADFIVEIRPAVFYLDYAAYARAAFFVAFVSILVFAFSGLYNIRGIGRGIKELFRVVEACSTAFVLLVILVFFQRELFDSRFILLAAWLISIIYVAIGRLTVRAIQRSLFKKGVGVHKVVLVGDSRSADLLTQEYASSPDSGYEVLKRYRDFTLETAQEFDELLVSRGVDEVIQTDPNLSKAEVLRLFSFAEERHLTFKYAADLLDAKILKTEVDEVAGIPIVEVKKTPLDGWGRISKRIFDIIVSLIIIIILSPILIITALLIKLDSRGPVFFSSRDDGSPLCRIGQGGRPFRYFKFRSMVVGQDSLRYTVLAERNVRTDGPMVKIKDDPRVTRVGTFIRRWSVDELPELFLVLRGDMSLVGPRPHLPEEVAKYESRHKKVLAIKPGITGMAQVSGRSDLSFEEEVKLDSYYIENWSLLLDLSILLRTPLAVFKHREVA